MKSSNEGAGGVLQRLLQEKLRIAGPAEQRSLLNLQHQATGAVVQGVTGVASQASAVPSTTIQPVLASELSEPQGQEHQGGEGLEKQSQWGATAPSPALLQEELPSYEEAKAHSQLYGGFSTDDGLKDLKQGHVRSLSERLMQKTLQHSGAKTSLPQPDAVPEVYGASFRGPPPDYPFIWGPSVPTTSLQSIWSSPPLPPTPAAAEIVRYQAPPEYTAAATTPYHQFHSPSGSQGSVSSLSGMTVLSPAGLPPVCPYGSLGFTGAFGMHGQEALARVQHTANILAENNRVLRSELDLVSEKEMQRIVEHYDNLVKSTSKRENLEKAMQTKLESEIRRLHESNRDLRERLETMSKQLAGRENDGAEENRLVIAKLVAQNKENLVAKEKIDVEVSAMRTTSSDQRRHIELLNQALNTAQAKNVKLEEEYKDTQINQNVYKSACQVDENDVLCCGHSQIGSCPFAMLFQDSHSFQFPFRDTTLITHSPHGSFSGSSLEVCMPEEEEEGLLLSNRRCHDMESRIKTLHAQIIEKDAMIKVLQQRSRKEHKAESSPAILWPAACGLTTTNSTEDTKASLPPTGPLARLASPPLLHRTASPSQMYRIVSSLQPSLHSKSSSKDSSTQTEASRSTATADADRRKCNTLPRGSKCMSGFSPLYTSESHERLGEFSAPHVTAIL
uniref:Angiomotin n=1 Tax=Eptatretus burgeri TaxID=7764 RepID=A0A8C4QCK1_EPTBU